MQNENICGLDLADALALTANEMLFSSICWPQKKLNYGSTVRIGYTFMNSQE